MRKKYVYFHDRTKDAGYVINGPSGTFTSDSEGTFKWQFTICHRQGKCSSTTLTLTLGNPGIYRLFGGWVLF